MYAAVVKFDTLSDSVRTAAEDHDLVLIVTCFALILDMIRRIVISIVFGSAYVNTFPGLLNAKFDSLIADVLFRNRKNLAQVFIREAMFLSGNKLLIGWKRTFGFCDGFFFLNKFFHLFNKVVFYFCNIKDFVYGSALSKCLIHNEMAVTRRSS